MGAVLRCHRTPDDASSASSSLGNSKRRKLDDGAPSSSRSVLTVDAGLLLDRAIVASLIPAITVANALSVAPPSVARWRHDPITQPPPLAAVLAHPAVTVEATALLLLRVAEQLVVASTPLDVRAGVERVRAATAELEAVLARRAR